MNYKRALIIGTGPGVSGCFARAFAAQGGAVHLAARGVDDLADLAAETRGTLHTCDAASRDDIFSTSFSDTRSALAVFALFSGLISPPLMSLIMARTRRRLKNSVFCADVVPVRTIDQLRST